MTFKIVVCIKQVPDTNDIKWTKNNTIQREGLDSVINPCDISALQFANNFKYVLSDVEIIAVTMGPNQAQSALKQAISISADKAYLLCDKRFAGADTLATAYTLSKFVETICPDFNLILCGHQAVDGDTAQTPSSLAEKLSIPQITNVVGVSDISFSESTWIRNMDNQREIVKISHPALVAISNIDLEIIPNINAYIKAQNASIMVLSADDIDADESKIGLKGSPTQVKNAYRPVISRENHSHLEYSGADFCEIIMSEINNCRLS